MSESVASIFESSLERYKSGEKPENLIPVFSEICDKAPKNATAWSCLAWLYLLVDKPNKALKAAKKSVKLDGKSAQSRINLALAMLETESKGVRPHVEVVKEMMKVDEGVRSTIEENIKDGLSKKPDWESLNRIKNWLAN